MRSAGEFFAWLWGPSEAEQSQRAQTRPMQANRMQDVRAAVRTQQRIQRQVIEQKIEDGRIVLRRITVEEIEIHPHSRRF